MIYLYFIYVIHYVNSYSFCYEIKTNLNIFINAPDFLPTVRLSDRVSCYDRLLLILCVTISVTFTDYDDV